MDFPLQQQLFFLCFAIRSDLRPWLWRKLLDAAVFRRYDICFYRWRWEFHLKPTEAYLTPSSGQLFWNSSSLESWTQSVGLVPVTQVWRAEPWTNSKGNRTYTGFQLVYNVCAEPFKKMCQCRQKVPSKWVATYMEMVLLLGIDAVQKIKVCFESFSAIVANVLRWKMTLLDSSWFYGEISPGKQLAGAAIIPTKSIMGSSLEVTFRISMFHAMVGT